MNCVQTLGDVAQLVTGGKSHSSHISVRCEPLRACCDRYRMNHYLIMTISGAFPLTFMAVPGQAMSCQQVIPVAVKLRRAVSETDELARLQWLGGGVGLANCSQPMKTPPTPPPLTLKHV